MKTMRPDQIKEEIERQREKELRDRIFLAIMLVIIPMAVVVSSIASYLS